MNVLTNILTVANRIAEARAKSKAVAAKAGARGQAADPLHARRRERNYQRQNGTERLTPRQRRRADHKANLAAKRAELAA